MMENVQTDAMFDCMVQDAERTFIGWDFSSITDRMREMPRSWSYMSKIMLPLSRSRALLDMGTGGGEFLSRLQPLPEQTFATEAYKPNVQIAKERLESLGVQVCELENDENLPFTDEQFDLVINRHESYVASEVYRVLQPNGLFITQQVGGLNHLEMNRLLGANEDFGQTYWNLDYAMEELEQAGFTTLEKIEEFPKTRFYDVGAIIYYLKAIPWQILDFSVEKYKDALFDIHQNILKNGYLDIESHRFLIIAEKK